jgi:hypothetical protein
MDRPLPRRVPEEDQNKQGDRAVRDSGHSVPDLRQPMVRPSVAEGKKPIAGPDDALKENIASKRFPGKSSENTDMPPRGLSLSALRDGGAGMRREDKRDHDGRNTEDGSSPDQASAKKVVRPSVDIEGLRRAINESLKKQNEGEHAIAPKATYEREEPKRNISREGHSSGEAAPTRTVRLNVPAHEDADANEQVNRELSKMDAEQGIRAKNDDDSNDHDRGQDEQYDSRSIQDAREKIKQALASQNTGFAGPTLHAPFSSDQKKTKKDPDIITSG